MLNAFLALHATVNAFVRTTAVLRGRPGWAGWGGSVAARAGTRLLL